MQDSITVYIDGACRGNPGPGGWGALLTLPDVYVKEIGGAHPQTTNNKMELTAAIEALKTLQKRTEKILIYCDSKYVIQGITEWIFAWEKNEWKSKEKKPVANVDLWKKLLEFVRKYPAQISWRHVKGHSGNPGNDRVDEIAVAFSRGENPRLFQRKL